MVSSFTLGIQQVKNGKNSGDVCIRFVIKKYITPSLKSFIPSFFLLAVFVARGNAQSIESFSNFEDVTQTFYHEVTGRPYLNFSYAKISKEYRKFKFLKFGLPNFIVHGLKVQFDLVSYDHAQILRKLSDFEKKSALRFVLARDSNLKFNLPQNQILHLDAKILKTGNSGNFRAEGAELTIPGDVQSYQSLILSFEYGRPGFQINKDEDPATSPNLVIFYGNPATSQESGKNK
jgi:hypothetical protein